jgi:hypothetical protein
VYVQSLAEITATGRPNFTKVLFLA